MSPLRHLVAFLAFTSLLPSPAGRAAEEIPIGSKKADLLSIYGQPDAPPIGHGFTVPGSTPTKIPETISYGSLKPPRFYWISSDYISAVHYYNLTGYSLDSVNALLQAHAKGTKLEEVAPSVANWPDESESAWICKARHWIALYRDETSNRTAPSLLIRTEEDPSISHQE